MRYIANAFSLQMLNEQECSVHIQEIDYDTFKVLSFGEHSVIGHKDLADFLGVEYNRESIKVVPGDTLFVAQLFGGRLPENCKVLPDDIKLKFFMVHVGGGSLNG